VCSSDLKVITREGTVVHPRPPAPVTLATNHYAQEIAEAMIKALARSCPGRVLAGWSRRFRIAIKGVNPRTKRPFIWHMFHARGGGGASSAGDGWETAGEGQAVGGIKFGSVEVAEVRFPLTFEWHEFRPGSAGDGQHRGGVGSVLRLRVDTVEDAVANTAGDGTRHPSYGILGGKDGLPHRYRLLSRGRAPRVLKTKEVGVPVRPGDVFFVESAGGGGWGPPAKRRREARAADVDNGFVRRRRGADHARPQRQLPRRRARRHDLRGGHAAAPRPHRRLRRGSSDRRRRRAHRRRSRDLSHSLDGGPRNGPPTPSNARHAPAKPGRSSVTRYTLVPQGGVMDRRLSELADQLAAGLIARREFLRRAAVVTGGTAAGLHVLRRMASAQSGPKLRVWLFKSYVTAGNEILARHVETWA